MEKIVVDQTTSAVPVVQTPLYNLVVIGGAPSLEITVTRIASTIPGVSIMTSAGDDLNGQLQHSILCSIAPDGKRTFCGEYTRVPALDREEMAANISRLIVPDVPVYAWIPADDDIEKDYPWLAPQVDVLIVNECSDISKANKYPILDMSWLRLTQWMEAVAEVFDVPEVLDRAGELEYVRMRRNPLVQQELVSAKLMAGWFTHCLKDYYPSASETREGLILTSGEDNRQLCISADDWRDFDEIEFGFTDDSSNKVTLKSDGNGIGATGGFAEKLYYPIRSDAELLADEINGRNTGSLYGEIVKTMCGGFVVKES